MSLTVQLTVNTDMPALTSSYCVTFTSHVYVAVRLVGITDWKGKRKECDIRCANEDFLTPSSALSLMGPPYQCWSSAPSGTTETVGFQTYRRIKRGLP